MARAEYPELLCPTLDMALDLADLSEELIALV